MRLKEKWMQKGAKVKLRNTTGQLTSLIESKIGNKKYVLNVDVKPAGVKHSFPFNPNDIDQLENVSGTSR